MTKQIKTIGRWQRFSWLKPQSTIGYSALLQITTLSLFLFQFLSKGQAQGIPVDLYNWTDESVPITGLIHVNSSNGATFIGDYANFPTLDRLSFSTELDTTPGATYEVSFTLQNAGIGDFGGAGDLWFGNCETNLDYAFEDGYITAQGYVFPSVNYDFTAVAASTTTSMSFDFVLDEGLNADLSNLEIREIPVEMQNVPEMSATGLLCYGGCLMLLARQVQKLTQKQRLALKSKARLLFL